jgi:site-specific recombinase XerD
MPRYREPFTIFPRTLPSGRVVYYYRTYSPDGERTTAHSTGKTNKTQARCYCASLLEQGLLYSGSGMTFGVYAKGFFDDNSQWMADKIQAGQGKEQPVAVNTLKSYRHSLETYLLPFFKNIKLFDLKPSHIRKFRAELIEKELSNSVINLACTCLKIIVSYASADRLITTDPFASVPMMYVNAKTKSAFTLEELKKTFNKKWENTERKTFSLVAAVTGMRISEVYAIRKETLFENYIDVKDQTNSKVLQPVKDGEKRKVRITPELYELLMCCIRRNGNFAFSEAQDTYRNAFYRNCGYSQTERIKKNLSFHSLRHFFNTYLLTNGISEIKVKYVLGHSSGKGSMTERYANFQPEHFDDVAELQRKLLNIFLLD